MKILEVYNQLINEETLLNEVFWVRDKIRQFKEGNIPLTPSIVRRLLGEPKKIETFHITDEKHIDGIKKILGKRNSISTFKYFSERKIIDLNGIQTMGGIIIKLEGILDFASSQDISSELDTSLNRRWIRSTVLSDSLNDDLVSYFEGINFSDKISLDLIKKYILKIYELLDKYKKEIEKNLLGLILDEFKLQRESPWNELLVRNIRIKAIAWKPTKIYQKCIHDNSLECKELIDEIEMKLNELAPNNVTTINTDDNLLDWYKKNGGYTNIEDFKREYLKK